MLPCRMRPDTERIPVTLQAGLLTSIVALADMILVHSNVRRPLLRHSSNIANWLITQMEGM